MDENQIDKLGSKMRDVYADVASEVPVPTREALKRPSHRLRKSRTFGRPSGRKVASAPGRAAGGFVTEHPMASLLVAVGVGYLLGRP